MDKRCKGCKNYYEDSFCSYNCSCCLIYGCIDCNPDNILLTFNGPCIMYNKDLNQKTIDINIVKKLQPFIDF